MDTQNPLEELSLLFSKDGLLHTDLVRLNASIDKLSSTLKSRAGVTDEDDEDAGKTKRTFSSDLKAFGSGLILQRERANIGKYFNINKSLPESVEKNNRKELDKIDPVMNKEDVLEKDKVEPSIPKTILSEKDKVAPSIPETILSEKDKVEPSFDAKAYDTEALSPPLGIVEPTKEKEDTSNLQSESDNKILSDMVEVLIDLRDDKSQKQILDEAIAIRTIISDQAKKVALPAGIEPNSEDSKQEDREKLAEAIARRLEDVIGSLGSGGLGIPDLIDRTPGKPGGKTPPKVPSGAPSGGSAGGAGKILGLGGKLLGGAGLAYSAYEASEFLDETGYGNKMNEGAGKTAETAFRENVAPAIDPLKAGVSADEARAALENGSTRDIEKLGGREALENIVKNKETTPTRSIQKISSNYTAEEANSARANFASTDPRRVDVQPKETQLKLSDILNNIDAENTSLKMFNQTGGNQMIAPIVSSRTINNNEQTILAAPSVPHSNYSGLQKFQNKVNNFY
jgi:hypothetical protein